MAGQDRGMKKFTHPFAALALLSFTPLASAHETTPAEITKLQEKHAARITKANEAYLRELGKLKAKFLQRDDFASAGLATSIIRSLRPDGSGLDDLCQIRVSSGTKVSAETLEEGAPRLSGGYRPSFSNVAEEMKGAEFLRAPWKSKPTYEVEVIASGYLYFFGVDGKTIANTTLKLDAVPGKLKGSYIGTVYAVHVTAGQTFQCGGYETCLIAQKISVHNR
jgi:hypothetical protein